MSERSTPFHCPYCGEEDLRPHEEVADDDTVTSPHGAWHCRGCLRAFSLKLLGVVRPSPTPAPSTTSTKEVTR